MTEALVGYLPEDRQNFGQPVKTLGDAMSRALKVVAPDCTSKDLQRRWSIDPHTAENVKKRVASGTTLVKAVRAERGTGEAWALWDALGEALIGESRDQYEERQLLALMKEAELARQRLGARRARRTALEAQASELSAMGHR